MKKLMSLLFVFTFFFSIANPSYAATRNFIYGVASQSGNTAITKGGFANHNFTETYVFSPKYVTYIKYTTANSGCNNYPSGTLKLYNSQNQEVYSAYETSLNGSFTIHQRSVLIPDVTKAVISGLAFNGCIASTGQLELHEQYDATPPIVPRNFMGTVGIELVNLSWSANTETDLQGYNIYKNGVKINSSIIHGNNYQVNPVEPDQSFAYQISAVDISGNESPKSSSISLTALPQLPVITLEAVNITDSALRLQWIGDVLGNKYDVYMDGVKKYDNITGNFNDISLLSPDTEYHFQLKGKDRYERDFMSGVLTVKTKIPSLDSPVVNVLNLSHNSFKLAWSTVKFATGYKVFIDNVEVYTGTDNNYIASGLTPSTKYDFKVMSLYASITSETVGHVTTTEAPLPFISTAKVDAIPGQPDKRSLSYVASPDVTDVKVFLNGQLVGTFPVSQGVIELDYSAITDAFADIELEPIPSGKNYKFKALAQSTGDEEFDHFLSNFLTVFSILKKSFAYVSIPLIALTCFVLMFFWTRKKYKKVAKINISDKPFADSSNMKDSKAKKMKRGFTVDDMPNDDFPVPRYKPYTKMSDQEKLEYRSRKHEEKTGFKIIERKLVDKGGLFHSRPVEKLTFEKNGIQYVQKQVKVKGRGRQTVYEPRTFNDKVKHVSNQINTVKTVFTGSNKNKKFH